MNIIIHHIVLHIYTAGIQWIASRERVRTRMVGYKILYLQRIRLFQSAIYNCCRCFCCCCCLCCRCFESTEVFLHFIFFMKTCYLQLATAFMIWTVIIDSIGFLQSFAFYTFQLIHFRPSISLCIFFFSFFCKTKTD